jgi:hypothetical protein
MVRTNKIVVNPFVADLWKSGQPNHRWSCQVHLRSGNEVHLTTLVRISSDSNSLIIRQPKSTHFFDPRDAFSYIVMPELLWDLHPRCVARVETIAKLKGRDVNKELYDEQIIPIPFNAKHLFANTESDGDEIWIGKKFVVYPDGEVHVHVEVAKDIHDSYKHSPDKPDLERASPLRPSPYKNGGVPAYVGAGAGTGAAAELGGRADDDEEMASAAAMPPPQPRQPSPQQQQQQQQRQQPPEQEQQAKVLDGAYDGAASRTRSQVKRRAKVQDDDSTIVSELYADN